MKSNFIYYLFSQTVSKKKSLKQDTKIEATMSPVVHYDL
jgi:hypothetical protein